MKNPHVTTEDIIQACRRNEPSGQKALYEKFSALLYGVCLRYVRDRQDAEDVLMEGFMKIFSNLHQYSGEGSFEGWMRSIMVNQALMFLRKNNPLTYAVDAAEVPLSNQQWNAEDRLLEADILRLMNQLPDGYRTIFNLYVIEGYKHREIGELLGISIHTSKSQLIQARNRLSQLIETRDSSQQPGTS
jgi:RNA polymerase sigma factor (sigma-70 family)